MEDYAPHEVIELLLTYCIPRKDVNRQAHELINRFGSVAGVLDATVEELTEVPGIGKGAALFLHMLPDVFRRYALDRVEPGEPMDTVAKVGAYLQALYTGLNFERVCLLLFDNSMRLIKCCHVADGAVNSVKLSIRRITELVIFSHASSVVLAHNHPRGIAIPSGSDIEMTEMVSQALDIIGVPLLEHIIVAENTYTSVLRNRKGTLRAAPGGKTDEQFYRHFYGESNGAATRYEQAGGMR